MTKNEDKQQRKTISNTQKEILGDFTHFKAY